ncbi:MAG: ABC transporter permease [Pseudomonadales bacterium]|nr:ABC transporter permease [Pseudomonadales bacterium]
MSAGAVAGRILAVAGKELLHLRRDRLTAGMILGIPVVLTVLFGYAINQDVRGLPAWVADQAGTSASRALVQALEATGVVTVTGTAADPAALEDGLARGRIVVGVYVPPDLETRLARGDRPLAQLLVDGSDPVVLSAVRGLVQQGRSVFLFGLRREDGFRPERMTARAGFALRALYNPERRSPVFIVPGLVGVILTLTMVLFTAVAIVRERERGSFELLVSTPVRSLELMVGKILPYVFIGYVQASVILALGVFLFDLPVRGSLADFYLAAGAFVVSILSLGLLISALARTQFQAFQLTFMSFLPQLLLSGFMFPFDGMPEPVQWLAELFPLTHFLRIVRGVVLRDAELAALSADLWPLGLFFLLFMSLATTRFRKRLD